MAGDGPREDPGVPSLRSVERKILEKAFSGGGTVRKGFIVQYVLKFLGLAAVVYLVVRSGWFDVLGFLLGLSCLFLGILLEGLPRAAAVKTK